MKNLLVVCIAVTALCGAPALAADMAVKAQPIASVPAPVYGWTGWYAGINAGYSWSNSSIDTTATDGAAALGVGINFQSSALTSGSNYNIPTSQQGFIGGGQVGYNYQMGAYLAGFETDIQGIASRKNGGNVVNSIPFGAAFQNVSAASNMRIDYLGTLRGRLGIIVRPSTVIYATGGLAYGGVSAQTQESAITTNGSSLAFGSGNFSTARAGYTIGGGAEMLLNPKWSIKAEYLYYDLGSAKYSLSPLIQFDLGTQATSTNATSTARFNGSIARAGVNYHF
jgi:outer membrane immunogenic protein